MKDRFNKEVEVGDYVWFSTYKESWNLGIVARIRPYSIRCFSGWIMYGKNNGTLRYYTHDKRSTSKLIVLGEEQISFAVTEYPFVSKNYTYEEFLEKYDQYCLTL